MVECPKCGSKEVAKAYEDCFRCNEFQCLECGYIWKEGGINV